MLDEERIAKAEKLIRSLNGVDKATILVTPDRRAISDVLVVPYPNTRRPYKYIQKDIFALLVNEGFPEVRRESISIAAFKRTV
ncbi:MAG: hypothetical protein ACUVXI_17645 [bacterium]